MAASTAVVQPGGLAPIWKSYPDVVARVERGELDPRALAFVDLTHGTDGITMGDGIITIHAPTRLVNYAIIGPSLSKTGELYPVVLGPDQEPLTDAEQHQIWPGPSGTI